jgi:Undecaprenyl-phosphate glucose phosphotransferase
MNFAKPASSVASAPADALIPTRQQRKWPISYRSVGMIAVASDIATILFCGVAGGAFYSIEKLGASGELLHYAGSAAVVAALFVSLMKARNLYSPAELLARKNQISATITTWVGIFLFLFGVVFAMKIGSHFSRGATFSLAAGGLVLLIAERLVWRDLLTHGLSEQRFSGRNAILITDDSPIIASDLASTLLKHGFQLDRQFVLPVHRQGSRYRDDDVSDIIAYLRGSNVEEVILGIDAKRWGNLNNLLSALRILPLPVNLIPVGAASDILSRPSHVIGQSVCIELQRGPLGPFERGMKRCIDIVGALLGLLLLSPLLSLTAMLIKLDSPGPILFRQRRCGFNGRQFQILKFRTMSVLEDGQTVCQASEADGRITRLGKWLRRTSIDELPQLLNVLNGSMSLIGPRPHAVAHDNQFDKIVSNYAFRHHVRPGLTGWAQVNGQRGPTPTVADIQRRVEYDLWYIDNWSFRLDFVIGTRTILEVLRGRNAY